MRFEWIPSDRTIELSSLPEAIACQT